MRINFRQGLVAFQKDSGNPTFIQPASQSGFVDHVVQPTPTIAAFAQGSSDYLQVFDSTKTNAWGPLVSGSNNYLYWDIDPLTSDISYGLTTVTPVTQLTAPTDPVNGQHWFDLTTKTMKVWSAVTNRWQTKIRVFAGYASNGNANALVPNSEGSQVGLVGPASPGFIALDSQLQPLRKSSGEFLTDSAAVHVRSTVGTAGVLVQPVNRLVPVRAGENIPRMSLVYFSGDDQVKLASSNPSLSPARIPVGVLLDAVFSGDVGTLTPSGELTYDQWNWDGHAGAPLYCGDAGEITLTRPEGLLAYRVGFVKNATSILLNIDAETNPQVYSADVNSLLIVGSTPVTTTSLVNGVGERVVTITVPNATPTSAGLVSPAQAALITSNAASIVDHTAELAALEAGKANTVHTHIIADTTGLQAALDAKFPANGNFDTRYSLLTHNHDLLYSPIGHLHQIPDVIGLQTALNAKAQRVHVNSFTEVFETVDRTTSVDSGAGMNLIQALAAKANTVHTHVIGDVTNLQAALDGKANTVHGHVIDDVSGLQAELDQKAFVSHTQPINTIIGLQTALNALQPLISLGTTSQYYRGDKTFVTLDKTAVGLSHVDDTADATKPISAPTQAALDGKANTVHTHVAADITNFAQGVNSSLVAGPNIMIAFVGGQTRITGQAGGSLTFSGLEDVNVTPSDGDIIRFDFASGKWVSAAFPAQTPTDLSGYLPLTGGTLTGDLIVRDGTPTSNLSILANSFSTIGSFRPDGQPAGYVYLHSGETNDDITGRILFNGADNTTRAFIGYANVDAALQYSAAQHLFSGDIVTGAITISSTGSIKTNGSEGTAGQILTSTGPGTAVQWTDPATSGATALAALTDVAVASPPNSGDVLTYDGFNGRWVNQAPAAPSSGGGTSDVTVVALNDMGGGGYSYTNSQWGVSVIYADNAAITVPTAYNPVFGLNQDGIYQVTIEGTIRPENSARWQDKMTTYGSILSGATTKRSVHTRLGVSGQLTTSNSFLSVDDSASTWTDTWVFQGQLGQQLAVSLFTGSYGGSSDTVRFNAVVTIIKLK